MSPRNNLLLRCVFRCSIFKSQRRQCSTAISNGSWKNVLDYWFAPAADMSRWFGGGAEVDKEIKDRFGEMVEKAQGGGLKNWELEPRPSLALLIVCDQFSRTIFRGSFKSFAGDNRAIGLTKKFLDGQTHNHLKHTIAERMFIYMPMMHSENHDNQVHSIELYEALARDAEGTPSEEQMKMTVEFAKRHKEVVDRFDRYPARNAILGRKNTPAEDEFLSNIPDQYKW